MEQEEKASRRAREGLWEQYQKIIPQKPLRILLAAVAVFLVLCLIFGVVCGILAAKDCAPASGKAVEAAATETEKPASPQPAPTAAPTAAPTEEPTPEPTEKPTPEPTEEPTPEPTAEPTPEPKEEPTPEPTEEPTPEPTEEPTSEPAETPVPTPSTNYLKGKVYQNGDTDDVILLVQLMLMDLGYMDSDEPTDYFGNQTYDALVTFQRHNGLTPDGVIDEATFAMLADGGAREFIMQEGDEGDDVKEVQDRLYELGFLEDGSRTAVYGEKTASAVRAFQSANRLKVDGKVGAKTMNALYSSDVNGNYFKFGDSDKSIITYQKQLVALGYLDARYKCTGKMDRTTVSAIKLFQEANGLVRDGCLGPATTELLGKGDAVPYAIRLGMSGADVRAAQQRLYDLGYIRKSQITGYYGESTTESVKTFQKRNELRQSGEIDAKTLEKLNSSKAKAAAYPATPKPATPGPGIGPTPTPASGDPSEPLKGVEKLIGIAESKLGCKYVRGAKGPDTFDCSGFVYWCLNQAGVRQSYMTSILWRTCSKYKRINSMGDLKRGDILVFVGESIETGHVGIYLGDGKMIDASSSRGQVRITENNILKSVYWQDHFLMAYRIWG